MDSRLNSNSEFVAPSHDDLIWSAPELLSHKGESFRWIIEGVLKKGTQLLLAGPPKSGKSLVASEIALELSRRFAPGETRHLWGAGPKGENFPGFRILPKSDDGTPWKVLFFSLEMGPDEVSYRLRKQVDGKLTEGPAVESQLALYHLFSIRRSKAGEPVQDLEVVAVPPRPGQQPKAVDAADGEIIKSIITAQRPDVVIFDTLIQLHGVNENDNVLMKQVMRRIRKIAVVQKGREKPDPVAHIVLHHTRKEGGHFKAPLSPEIMRGAGAIHGVCDIVMLMRPGYKKGTLEFNVSSRSSSVPNFYLARDKATLTHHFVGLEKDPSDQAESEAVVPLEEAENLAIITAIEEKGAEGKKFTASELKSIVWKVRQARNEKREPKESGMVRKMKELVEGGRVSFTYQGHKRKHPDLKNSVFYVSTEEGDAERQETDWRYDPSRKIKRTYFSEEGLVFEFEE